MTNSVSNLWFVSFADSRMRGSLSRLRRQAKIFGFLPERTLIIDEQGLDADFRLAMKDRLVFGSRGFGYWCWKPQSVLQAFGKMKDGEVLVYADAGCHLNRKGRERLLAYLPLVEDQGIGLFRLRQKERQWTKGDLFDYFKVRGNPAVTDSGQIVGGVFLAKKTECIETLFRQHLKLLQMHTHLVDDTPSVAPNFPDFRENRHDQSAFSLRCKQLGYRTLDAREINDVDDGVERPIIAKRDIGVGWRGYVPFSAKRFCFACRDFLVEGMRSVTKW